MSTKRHRNWTRSDGIHPVFTEFAIKTPTNNGDTLQENTQYLVGGAALGDPGDQSFKLPLASTVRRGDEISVFCATSGSETFEITTQGTDTVIGMGASGGEQAWRFQGRRQVRFQLMGDPGFGAAFWQLIPDAKTNQDLGLHVTYANQATVSPLPAFTPSGTPGGFDETLTADANGALVADGLTISAGKVLLVRAESGANRAFHGLYNVVAPGDGGSPFVLRRVAQFATQPIDPALLVLVLDGTAMINTLHGWEGNPGDEAEFKLLTASHGLDLGTVSGAFNVDLRAATYQRFKLSGNATLTFTNLAAMAGKTITLEAEQSAAGGNTLGYANADSPGGIDPVLSVGADAVDLVRVDVSEDGALVRVTSIGQAYS